jgi:hypothetical protein
MSASQDDEGISDGVTLLAKGVRSFIGERKLNNHEENRINRSRTQSAARGSTGLCQSRNRPRRLLIATWGEER